MFKTLSMNFWSWINDTLKLTSRFWKWISYASFRWTYAVIASEFVLTDGGVMTGSAGTIISGPTSYNRITVISFVAPTYRWVISRFAISILSTNILYFARIWNKNWRKWNNLIVTERNSVNRISWAYINIE